MVFGQQGLWTKERKFGKVGVMGVKECIDTQQHNQVDKEIQSLEVEVDEVVDVGLIVWMIAQTHVTTLPY